MPRAAPSSLSMITSFAIARTAHASQCLSKCGRCLIEMKRFRLRPAPEGLRVRAPLPAARPVFMGHLRRVEPGGQAPLPIPEVSRSCDRVMGLTKVSLKTDVIEIQRGHV